MRGHLALIYSSLDPDFSSGLRPSTLLSSRAILRVDEVAEEARPNGRTQMRSCLRDSNSTHYEKPDGDISRVYDWLNSTRVFTPHRCPAVIVPWLMST